MVCGSQYARVTSAATIAGSRSAATPAEPRARALLRPRRAACADAGSRVGAAAPAVAAGAAPDAGGAATPDAGGDGADSEPMMLTGGIEEDEGNSYFDDTGTPDGAPGALGGSARDKSAIGGPRRACAQLGAYFA